ncbi:MAG TPA: ThuA domain-containing protein [Candidatus Acidoferrum sp.]|nr:ThuA domain-containing protein [Candidatus Acidoferrum sp.]
MINRRELLRSLGGAALGFAGRGVSFASVGTSEPPKRKKILMFTKSSGFEHSVIKRVDGRLGLAEQIVADLGKPHGFDVNATKDGGVFASPDLGQYDAFFFYTTGDLTTVGTDKNPPMTPEGKQAFLNLIHEGKGFIGTHSATDTFDTVGDRFDPKPQAELDPYLQMIGAEFLAHDNQQKARITVADGKFPGMAALGDGIEIVEEWYPFRDYQPNLHVLTILKTEGMQGPHYQRPPYPNTWARMHGRGRVFYTALGHREDVWNSEIYQGMLLGGISWVLRNVNADVTPNISRVAPHANDIPAGAFAKPH